MHITLEADYAVRIVEFLASCKEKKDASSIAENTSVPLRFALKILRKLVSNDIVSSFKGAKGGYILKRPPNEITLRQVIESVEGPYCISRCVDKDYPCGHTSCKFNKVYNEISLMVRQKLDEVNFS
mgnify:CR=1 FL=1